LQHIFAKPVDGHLAGRNGASVKEGTPVDKSCSVTVDNSCSVSEDKSCSVTYIFPLPPTARGHMLLSRVLEPKACCGSLRRKIGVPLYEHPLPKSLARLPILVLSCLPKQQARLLSYFVWSACLRMQSL
jgi:hypothetical protein